ncbi:MAG: transcriptional regulator GcvA [Rhodospirillaceae bacterium]|nr:transcriptional regulator GcvA [Rhodospirillaceae bacterium]
MTVLPSLNALRMFEAAGRHLSFTRAAHELNVTQAAVSHGIKSLEAQLGVRLFRRGARGLFLTDAGQAYLPEVREAFRRLAIATDRLVAHEAGGVLKVSVLPSFAARWLVPRLRHFRERHPEIDVLVSANDAPINFDREDVDVAIRYGTGDYPGLRVEAFMEEEVFPVLSPALRDSPPGLNEPADLLHYTLLHDDLKVTWAHWLAAAGVPHADSHRGPAFTDSSMLLQAAVDGQGVALGRSALAQDDLLAGRLVRPFALSLPVEYAYFIVYPEHTANRLKIRAFRDWLFDESGAERAKDAAGQAGDGNGAG